MSDVLLIVHILAAGTWIGAGVVQAFMGARMARTEPAAAANWQHVTVEMGMKVFSPAAILVLITGFGLIGVSEDAFGYGDAFVIVGIVVVVISAVLGIRFFGPQAEKAAQAYQSGDRSAADAIVRRTGMVGMVDLLLLVVAVVAMVTKWGIT